MRKEKAIFILIALSVFSITGCGMKSEDRRVEVFSNSQENTHFRIIEIEKSNGNIIVKIHYTEKENRYIGMESDDEILVKLENGDTLHMYKNGEMELRVYNVVQDGFQPEDIEWTFFKTMRYK